MYFIANWKMYGDLKSIKTLNKVIKFTKSYKNNKYKLVYCPPFTLLSSFSNKLRKTNIDIGAQNCHDSENYGAFTGSINSKMLKNIGANYVIIGHSDEVLIIADALKMSDVPANSCHAKAWIVFVRSDKNDAFDFGLQLTTMPDISSFKLDSKTFSGMLAVHNVEARLDVLHSRGLVEVVQAPHLQMSNNQISLIETGEEIAVPIVTVSQNVTQTTVEYRKVGLSLELTPQFLADDKIRLKIKQSNGLVGQLRDVGGVEVPELTNQSLMNTIETRVGKVVVLGGVESSQYQKVKGFLSYKKERQTGYLYVVLATYSSVPLAVPVLESVQDGSALLPPKPKNK
jgi:type II secretory pathway component GspD/PulD (secretin)